MSWSVLLEAAEDVRAVAAGREPGIAALPLSGIGWASVEHERAELELDGLLGESGSWVEIERDALLGARGWRKPREIVADGGSPELVVLEPDAEGRLAAALARFGEGVAVVYLGIGPPGPGRLVPGGPAWGPHAIVLPAGAR